MHGGHLEHKMKCLVPHDYNGQFSFSVVATYHVL